MVKGKAISAGKDSALGALKSFISPRKESALSALDLSDPRVDALCKPTEAKLWGYDIGKNMLSDTLDKSDTFHISQAASIMMEADGDRIVPVCKAFLVKFGFERSRLRNPTRETFFSGGNQQGLAKTPIKPQEMKYAVLILLGLSESVARNQLKLYDKDSPNRLAPSADFEKFVADVKEKRSMYPLEHTEEFTDVRNALEKVRPYIGNNIKVKNIFSKGGVPPHVMQRAGQQAVSPLVDALSNLALALKHGVSLGYFEYANPSRTMPSFSSDIIALVESRRKEKQTPKTPPTKGLG